MVDALTGGRYYQRGRHYAPYLAQVGVGRSVGFPVAPFQEAILRALKEVDAADVFGGPPPSDKAARLARELAVARGQLAEIGEGLLKAYSDTLAKAAQAREAEIAGLVAEEAAARATSPPDEALGEAKQLIDALGSADSRARLRSALLRAIESVQCVMAARGRSRLAAVQIHFKGGGRRNYVLAWSPGWPTRAASGTPEEGVPWHDFRVRANAENVLELLQDWPMGQARE
jgi:hypothetical protein